VTDTDFDAPATARTILRVAATGGLGTLGRDGAPFTTLVTVATALDGSPLLLLSDLAVHTRNLKRDPRASLLLVAPGGEDGDPLAGARVTVSGAIARADDEDDRRRFVARHGERQHHAGFTDFNFYRMSVERGHLVAGFGRIVSLTPEEMLTDVAGADQLAGAEAGAVAHMNEDHRDALRLYATVLLGLPDGDWTTTGADPDGLDLRAGSIRGRLPFPERVTTSADLRRVLVELVKAAREKAAA